MQIFDINLHINRLTYFNYDMKYITQKSSYFFAFYGQFEYNIVSIINLNI
jgi:hypothetical protein